MHADRDGRGEGQQSEPSVEGLTLGQPIPLDGGYGHLLAIAPDGSRFVSAGNDLLTLWEGDAMVAQQSMPIYAPRFDRAGRFVYAGTSLYDAEARAPVALPDAIEMLSTDDRGRPLHPGGFEVDQALWPPEQDQVLLHATYRPGREDDGRDAPERDERLLVINGRTGLTVADLDAPDGAVVMSMAAGETRWAVGFREIGLWSRRDPLAPGRFLSHHSMGVCALAFGAGERQLVSADTSGEVCLWRGPDFAEPDCWPAHARGRVVLDLHPTRALLVTGGSDGIVRVWSLDPPGELVAETTVGGRIEGLAVHPSGQRMLVAARTGLAQLSWIPLESP